MASKPSKREAGLNLGALLEPHLPVLGEAVREREQAERAARAQAQDRLRRLDEAELMALVFASLDHDNPRVCEGIDFDRLVILSRDELAARECPDAPEHAPEHQPAGEAEFELATGPDRVDASAWVGRGWVGDVLPTPAAVLDRPELDRNQHALLTRARRRKLDTINLRHLDRTAAIDHLALFVGACRARRLRFCRVIPGKGIHSKGEPVLKRAVIEWCRDPERNAVLGWAPELDRHGEWGTMILELRSRR